MSKALIAIDIQNGNVTPQTQDAVLLSLTALSGALSKGELVIVSTLMHSSNNNIMWDAFRAGESEALFSPMQDFITPPANTAVFQRTGESACTSVVQMLLNTHDIETIQIVGVNTGNNIIASALDFAAQGFQIELITNAIGGYIHNAANNLHNLIVEK